MDKRIGFGFYHRGLVRRISVYGCDVVDDVGGEWVGWVQVSVYYDRRIPAHLRCTQCSILLHLIDI